MARKIAEIQAAIIAEKDLQPNLSGLNNNSPTSMWRLWVYIVAVAIWLHEQLFDKFLIEAISILEKSIPGTPAWYYYQCLQFQNGYILEWNQSAMKYAYTVIDGAAKIIKLAAISVAGDGFVNIKVAKLDVSTGLAMPLASGEKTAFETYINRIKFAGTFTNVISVNPDLLKLYATIKYNGTIPLATIQANISVAINNYIQGLPFDGILRVSALQDAIQVVSGVIDVRIDSLEGKSITTVYQSISMEYNPYAGYLKIDSAFPISGTITYLPI